MPDFTTEIDIDPYDYVSECSSREIQTLIDELERRGFIKKNSRLSGQEAQTIDDDDFSEMVYKIMENKHQLTVADEEDLARIHSRLV